MSIGICKLRSYMKDLGIRNLTLVHVNEQLVSFGKGNFFKVPLFLIEKLMINFKMLLKTHNL